MKNLFLTGLILATSFVLIVLAVNVFTSNSADAVPPRANLRPSDYATDITYFQAMKSQKPMVVNFYVDWCGYCQRLAPVLNSLKNQYKSDFNFVWVNCEDKKYGKIVEDYGIDGYPTLYIVDPKKDNRVMISKAFYGRPEKLSAELNRFLKVNNYKKK